MGQQTINSNTVQQRGGPNIGDAVEEGDSWAVAVKKMNAMFAELYALGPTDTGIKNAITNFSAVADGATDTTTALAAFVVGMQIGVLSAGNYVAAGSVGAPNHPSLILSDNAEINGARIPLVSLSKTALKLLPANYLFIAQDTTDRADTVTVQLQRNVNTDDGLANPKCLRAVTNVNVNTAQDEWAISGETNNYSDTSSTGVVAVSGVSTKHGLGGVFGGHFQAKDYNLYSTPADVTPLVGVEINAPSIGLDHPSANHGQGNRILLNLIARTNEEVTGWTDGETGSALWIKTDATTDGYFRYGMVVDDISQQPGNPNSIGTAILVQTSGPYGIQIKGNNSSAALDIQSGIISVNDQQVIAARDTGWAAMTGAPDKASTFNTTSVTLEQLAERVMALQAALAAHGLIGT